MLTLIADIETDGLLPEMTRLWCIQIGSDSGDDVTVYADQPGYPPISAAIDRLKAADRYVFHNGLSFDMEAINRFYPGTVVREKLFDTLVAARLFDPEERSHSLKSWGERLGLLKGEYKGDFSTFTQDLVDYAIQDIHVGRALYRKVSVVEEWGESFALESEVAWLMLLQEQNGFGLDVAKATALEADLRQEMASLDADLARAFPPLARSVSFTPKASNRKHGYVKGVAMTKTWSEVFNPSSRQQIEDRLKALGWVPKAFTPDGHAKIDETVLAKLPYEPAKLLLRRFRVEKLLGQLSDGKNGWLKLAKNGRIHGRVNHNGACTGRMSHSRPNVAQVDKLKAMRECWVPRPDWSLVGVDAEGIEARCLGHYLHRYDGGSFIDVILNGKKEDGTDLHSRNAKAVSAAGFKVTRDGAKTLLYALMYGAGDVKLGMTVRDDLRAQKLPLPKLPPRETGALVRKALARSMVGIDKLTQDVLLAVKERGFLKGLDGRQVKVRSAHSALNTLLQGAGAIVMKKALCLFMDAHGHDHGDRFGLCANVHDEVQIECEPEIADDIGTAFASCITAAGMSLGVRCPLAGAYAVGSDWSSTH